MNDSPQTNNDGQNLFRPQSSRVGIGPIKYVWWNWLYPVVEFLNRRLSSNPNRKISWDKWRPYLGLVYLMAKLRFNRSNALTDPYSYATNDNKQFGAEPEAARHAIVPDGTYVVDNDNPQMGAANTRFGSNSPPRKVRPDVENMTPSAFNVAKLRARKIDPNTGKEITIPAMILNAMAAWWIQFQFHNFGGNTKRDPINQNPHRLERDPQEGWPDNVGIVDRTTQDPTRVTYNGRPTPINEKAQSWVQGQIYGSSEAELANLRSFECGKLRLDENGHLPPDPNKPGVDLTGFSNNFNPGLSFLHWLFVMEHNALADHYAYFHPDWDDERLFQMARKANCAQIARIHTIQWTEDLLQHPTLQLGMHADWYGFLGQKLKLYLMRLCNRRPWISRLLKPFRDNDFIWGMPGSKWEHHDGPFQVPVHFRMVYRLHELVLSEQEIVEPETNRTLDRIGLIDFVHHNTRPIVEKFGYDVIAWSFVSKSCGALTLHNFPRALMQFTNLQNGALTNLAELDIFRERTDGTGTYNQFRHTVGEPPVTSFAELTGGDMELARELEIMYEGDVDKVDAGIGILVEPKPDGFALGFCQFYQFVLNAPRRVKSNRHLSEGYNYAEYAEGMDWVEHGGGILGVMARHLPRVRPLIEGVLRGFAPWQETETFPLRMLTKTHEDTGNVVKSDLRTLALGAVTATVAVLSGACSLWLALLLLVLASIIPLCLTVKRMFAMRFMQQVWQKCYTDKRGYMFETLAKGESWLNRAAHLGRLQGWAVVSTAGALAWIVCASHPVVAALLVVVALTGFRTRKWSNAFADDAQILKISLRNRLREGQPVTNADSLPGETTLAKRYWFLKGSNPHPVATFSSMFKALRRSGLPFWKTLGTTLMSLLLFGPKTQRGMTRQQKRAVGIGLFGCFKIYIPNLFQAEGNSASRIYALPGNTKGLRPGDLDMDELQRAFMTYAPGRDYLTAYDFSRMREGNCLRDAREGRGNCITRFFGSMAAKRRHEQLLLLFADRVVEEDRKLVPAISAEMLLRFYQGAAQHDLDRERQSNTDPSLQPTGLWALSSMKGDQLERIYSSSPVGETPDGESQGKAIVLPGTFCGKLTSWVCNKVWKGKVFDRKGGRLLNKILGLRIVKAAVFKGESWSDGKESIIIDYKWKSLVAFLIRDEIRAVKPGLYLGKAYIRLPFGMSFSALYFALDFRK